MASINGSGSEASEIHVRSVTPDGGLFEMDLDDVPCKQFMPGKSQPRPIPGKENPKNPRETKADTAGTEQGVFKMDTEEKPEEPCKRPPLASSPENRSEDPAFLYGESFFCNETALKPLIFPDSFV